MVETFYRLKIKKKKGLTAICKSYLNLDSNKKLLKTIV